MRSRSLGFRSLGRWALLGVALLSCLALGYAAYTLAGYSWDSVVSYESPYAAIPLKETQPGSAVASRTVLVIVDGLRFDASERMGTVAALSSHGSRYRLVAPQPSLSYPNWTTILTGAPPYISGVVTNWHEGASPVETLFDTAQRAGVRVVFAGPEDFEPLYSVSSKTVGSFMRKWDKRYLSSDYVDAALSLAQEHDPALIVVHLPDVDEAGHAEGGASPEYRAVVSSVDADLNRLVAGLQDRRTTFVVVSDHGHIDSGGHGGWETDVVEVPFAMAGPGSNLAVSDGRLEQVAPTVAYLSGIPVPRHATQPPLTAAVGVRAVGLPRMRGQLDGALIAYASAISSEPVDAKDPSGSFGRARSKQVREERAERLPMGLAGAVASVFAITLIGVASWRALIASLVGTAAYYLAYNALFFGVHGHVWSLSAFNSEDLIERWMNTRLVEAAAALLIATAATALVYPFLRDQPRRPSGPYLAGWLMLGPVTAIAILATIGLQVAWFVWWWGIAPEWGLPDLKWGFKYDLDLIQATAIGFAALLAPAVTYLVGRLHPRVRLLDPN